MTMATLNVFDPALCCTTGVCGAEVDASLVRFAADVDWLKGQGAEVRRFNLAQEPGVFAANTTVHQALMQDGVSCLPLLMVDGEVVSRGAYPDRSELARLMDVEAEKSPQALRLLPIGTKASQSCTPDSGCC